MPTVEEFQVCVPILEEQDRVVRVLNEQLKIAEPTQQLLGHQRINTETLKPALLRAAFSGQL